MISTVVIGRVIGGLVLAGLVYAGWKQIPAEDPEIVKARAEYGKAGE